MSPEAKARRRENRKLGKVELGKKNFLDIKDLTPYNAITLKGKNIIYK